MSNDAKARENMSLEARIWVMQSDIENLKMRDAELKSFQEKMNAAFYKIDGLEKIIEDHKERLDENGDMFKEAVRDIFKKIDDSFSKREEMTRTTEPPHDNSKSDKTELINTIAKIILVVLTLIGTSIFGIKSLGGG